MFAGSKFKWATALFALGICCALSALPAQAGPVVYTGGHGDIGLKYEDGELAFRYRFDSTATLDGAPRGTGRDQYDPGEILVSAGAAAYGSTFSDAYQALLGTTSAYSFGMNSSPIKPYLGIAAQDPTLPTASWINPDPAIPYSTWLGRLNLEITGVNYIGEASNAEFSLFSYSRNSVASPIYSSYTGESREIMMLIPGHGHYEWAFSESGIYEVSLKAWGVHAQDGYHETETTLRFQIEAVPEPSALALAGTGFVGLLCLLRKKSFKSGRQEI